MKNLTELILFFLLSSYALAKPVGSKLSRGFINDTYCTSFYYDEDNYYNDGLHLIDDNGDGIYEYYYFSLSGHVFKNAIAPNGYLLNQYGKFI